jgi:hypothetical protein
MKNFKPGQEVVYKNPFDYSDSPLFHKIHVPQQSEIVTLKEFGLMKEGEPGWYLEVYEYSKDGERQLFSEQFLYPIAQVGKEETEKLINNLEKCFNPEKQLVEVNLN